MFGQCIPDTLRVKDIFFFNVDWFESSVLKEVSLQSYGQKKPIVMLQFHGVGQLDYIIDSSGEEFDLQVNFFNNQMAQNGSTGLVCFDLHTKRLLMIKFHQNGRVLLLEWRPPDRDDTFQVFFDETGKLLYSSWCDN